MNQIEHITDHTSNRQEEALWLEAIPIIYSGLSNRYLTASKGGDGQRALSWCRKVRDTVPRRSRSCCDIGRDVSCVTEVRQRSLDRGRSNEVEEWPSRLDCVARTVERTEDIESSSAGCCDTEFEFQTSLRNERHHFLLADVLLTAMESMLAEECYLSGKGPSSCKEVVYGDCDYGWGRDSSVEMSTSSQYTEAERMALAILEEISTTVSTLCALDGRARTIPARLETLHTKLKKRCTSASTTGVDSLRSHDVLPETDQMSPSCIPCTNIDHVVGALPILGPNMSLPSYIVSRYPSTMKRAATLLLQQNMCPGCQCTFSRAMAQRMQLCNYYCHYFCSVCHDNQRMIIPARILTSWDFSKFPVSRPAADLLKRISTAPIFTLDNFSASVQSSQRVVLSVSRLRRQASFLVHFIITCRHSFPLARLLTDLPSHWFRFDDDSGSAMFSIEDCRLMKSGAMQTRLQELVRFYEHHVTSCVLCCAKGTVCELCHNGSDVIFPFQTEEVRQCPRCSACFHSRCYGNEVTFSCPRCERHMAREGQLIAEIDGDTGDTEVTT